VTTETRNDAWGAGDQYERYMGRWSRAIARKFLQWLDQSAGLDWLDVGCGTGALTSTILERCAPASVTGVDPSEGFVEHARRSLADPRVRFEVGSATELPCETGSVDVVTSALAYNFFPDRPAALAEMQRVTRPGGTVSFYVWDYPGGGIGFMRAFWQAAVALDPGAATQVESARFPFCTAESLLAEAVAAGLATAEVAPIEVTSRFEDFEDYWQPFTLGTGPAPSYCASLSEPARQELRARLEATLGGGGAIEFPARAWTIRARIT
jgi:SAM-dependent methyltransferase